jgi:hypothetical protein
MRKPITEEMTVPSDFHLLPVPMPPALPGVVGVNSERRFFSLTYEGSKPFWSDGRAGATFSYFAAYEPYIDHLAMAIHLFDVSLGHDDEPPAHSLLIDRQESNVYVGPYGEVCGFLEKQHPPRRQPTPAEIEEMNRELAEMERMSLDQLRDLGAFEFVFGPKPEQQDRCAEMVAWLDRHITEELIQSYVAAAERGQPQAIYHLSRFKQRVDYSRDVNTSSRLKH